MSGTDGTGVANEKAPDGLASRGLSLEDSESSSPHLDEHTHAMQQHDSEQGADMQNEML